MARMGLGLARGVSSIHEPQQLPRCWLWGAGLSLWEGLHVGLAWEWAGLTSGRPWVYLGLPSFPWGLACGSQSWPLLQGGLALGRDPHLLLWSCGGGK